MGLDTIFTMSSAALLFIAIVSARLRNSKNTTMVAILFTMFLISIGIV